MTRSIRTRASYSKRFSASQRRARGPATLMRRSANERLCIWSLKRRCRVLMARVHTQEFEADRFVRDVEDSRRCVARSCVLLFSRLLRCSSADASLPFRVAERRARHAWRLQRPATQPSVPAEPRLQAPLVPQLPLRRSMCRPRCPTSRRSRRSHPAHLASAALAAAHRVTATAPATRS